MKQFILLGSLFLSSFPVYSAPTAIVPSAFRAHVYGTKEPDDMQVIERENKKELVALFRNTQLDKDGFKSFIGKMIKKKESTDIEESQYVYSEFRVNCKQQTNFVTFTAYNYKGDLVQTVSGEESFNAKIQELCEQY